MDTTTSSSPPLTKVELGVIVVLPCLVAAGVFVSGQMGAETARKDRLIKEFESAIMDCLKATQWAAPNREELCEKKNEKRRIVEQEFGRL